MATTPSTPVQPSANIAGSNLRHVSLVSGQVIQVQGEDERNWFEATRDKYLNETKFSEATDLRDLDRLLVLELMVYRWTVFLAAGVDYQGLLIDEQDLQRNIKLYSDQINKVKDATGMSKKARDAEADKGNFAAYLADLKHRAKVFGVHREKQLTKALTLMKELFTVVEAFHRADEEERIKLGFESEREVMQWIREVMKPEFDALDEYFQKNEQRYWVRDQ